MKDRIATIKRDTKETKIELEINLDGSGEADINTGVAFFDHMLDLFSKHGFFDLTIKCDGDLEIDQLHSMEDVGIVLGQAIKEALGDKKGITRYGFFILPMDECLSRVVLDLSGRPCLIYEVESPSDNINGINVRLFKEFFHALTNNLGVNLHIDLIRGEDVHHILESVFKCFARALDMAVAYEPRQKGIPSTKGILD